VIQGDVARTKNISNASRIEDKIKALRGLTIGINAPGSASDQVLRYTARLGGIDPDREMKIVPVGGDSALIASFEQKRVDGFAWPAPASNLAVKKYGGVMVVNYTKGEFEPLRGFLYVSLISRTDWLNSNSDVATRLVRAFTKAQKLINEQPDEARAALRTFFPNMDVDAFNDGFSANAAAVPATLRIDPRSVALNKQFSEAVEAIKLDVDVANVFTNAVVDRAEARR
jgi:NitT/TauT family transport system substrate-binding protein